MRKKTNNVPCDNSLAFGGSGGGHGIKLIIDVVYSLLTGL